MNDVFETTRHKKDGDEIRRTSSPSRTQAEQAVRTLIPFIGDDPTREGVLDTPKRVLGALEEMSPTDPWTAWSVFQNSPVS